MVFSDHDTVMRCWFKGADTSAACRWLEYKYRQVLPASGAHLCYCTFILNALQGANDFLRLLYHGGLFLTKDETRRAACLGRQLLSNYERSAACSFSLAKPRFKITPKLHLFCHIVLHLEFAHCHRSWCLSPLAYACQLNEDLVGRTSAMSRACSVRTVHEKTLRKYLVSVKLNLCPSGGEKRRLGAEHGGDDHKRPKKRAAGSTCFGGIRIHIQKNMSKPRLDCRCLFFFS